MLSSTLPLAVVGATVVGFAVGFNVGATVVGATVVGFAVGFNVGATVVGFAVGFNVGATVVGATVVGTTVGFNVGATVGLTVVLSFFLVVSVLVVFTSALVVTICEGSLFVVT